MSSMGMPANDPRTEPFGYNCNRCRRCCYHDGIGLNPYEVARLARNRGVSTREFRAAFTDDDKGLILARTEGGACVFLGSEGCTVYRDRPLACRLYPLGRNFNADGTEYFFHVERHPQSRGELTRSRTIAHFLETQNAQPFIKAADDYYHWFCAASACSDTTDHGEAVNASTADAEGAHDLLDMDVAVAGHCTANGIEEPTDIEERRQMHLTILYQQLAGIVTESRQRT